jgi:aspartate/tyrosine/aromatic aminotransferase
MFFENINEAPEDPILGLTDEFNKDQNPKKVNLAVGVYQDDTGKTPTFESVLEAEKILLDMNISKSYKPIDGDKEFLLKSIDMIMGEKLLNENNFYPIGLNTPGGTGALKLISEFLMNFSSKSTVWFSNPTWPNHKPIFEASGFKTNEYEYFDKTSNIVDFEGMIDSVKKIPSGDIIVLHGCCHNPTGCDLEDDQWNELGSVLKKNKIITICDFAYQGLADGVDEDATGVRKLCEKLDDIFICSSYSKNFGLYSERVGCLIYKTNDQKKSEIILSQLKKTARTIYSNPPAHGSEIVKIILNDDYLKDLWIKDLSILRNRIKKMRISLNSNLIELECKKDFSFIVDQKGMFSFSGINTEDVKKLRSEYSIYIVDSGRVNIAGITSKNISYISESINKIV